MNNTPAPFDRQEIIRRERHLAKYANTMDSLFCIPFTKQGIGIDALLSLIPFVGDIAGLLLTLKAFRMGRELGVHARGAGKETGTVCLLAQTCRRLALSAPARFLRPRHAGFDDLGNHSVGQMDLERPFLAVRHCFRLVLKSVPLHWHKTRGRLKNSFQTASLDFHRPLA